MPDFEKLGVFYLGRPYDLSRHEPKPGLLLYDSKDLLTHAVCVGMTGSGKTGLCISLLEEAAIDGIPAIVIDPKGDLGNLLLTFPDCRAEDFLPWIDEEEARSAGVTKEEYARREADRWRQGLTDWAQSPDRIRKLRDAAEFAIYTPGSSAGRPVSILKSFAAPAGNAADDRESWRERISTTASSLLGLVGQETNPLESREHVLLSTLLDAAWKEGRDLDIGTLIQQIQSPPFARVGVMDIDSFCPPKDRMALALRINNLLASPGFEAWLEGEPLDIASFLHTPAGKPRIAIFSIAHLGDSERMFFVSLLLNQILGWMRAQPGTSSLRAVLYMDEIFGYFPPVANPPSKTPLLTLLKQARAFGLGVVLATQNPVDLDYKGLSNTGTWFLGRLQTERDKERVLEGLEGAAASSGSTFDRGRMEELLAGLGRRIFLMNNVHENQPEVFETRWTLSYLRGPLTRAQIRTLTPEKPPQPAARAEVKPTPAVGVAARPAVPPEIPQYFLPYGKPSPVYHPYVAGAAQLHFLDTKKGVDDLREVLFLAPITADPVPVDWANAELSESRTNDLQSDPEPEAAFTEVPAPALKPKQYAAWSKSFATCLFQTQKVELWRNTTTGLISRAGESERGFRARGQQATRESRDQAVDKLRARYATRVATLEDRLRRAEQACERQQQQANDQSLNVALSVGTGLLGALFGRKSFATQGAAAARSVARSRRESGDVERAAETVQAVRQQLADLEAQIQAETEKVEWSAVAEKVEPLEVRLKRTGITVLFVALAWKA